MLTDPDSYEEWTEEVWAASLEEAQTICQKIAGDDLTEVLNVTQKSRKPSKSGTFKFICWFKTEEP
jgi:hypothetical protein